ncbi:LLM class flavin-dependent oxidoreductase [Nonomuraea sp. KM90]|uniref:LLM class flavin-dependent oxidoreductase n=1 Tax=Nonomuraea sp. KM90 TaxID=3457428 RepID=UPI003FCE6CCE
MTLHLAVALDGAGWHPAAWREPTAAPRALFSARYWAGLVAEAERGLLDFVTIEDALGLQTDLPDRPRNGDGTGLSDGFPDGAGEQAGHVRGRFDAVLLAARLAPLTRRIGLVPTATTTHTEPFHVAIGIATLDHISGGRAGWRPQISWRASEARHFGRREFPPIEPGVADLSVVPHVQDLFAEAADAVETARRLWDSWEDDAEIRDVATGRFVDRDKLHYVDFAGRFFSVRGPSITPRSPQGQPVVTALAHARLPYEFAAANADVVYVTPHSAEQARAIVAEIRGLSAEVKVFADLVVFLGDDAAARKARLDELDGAELSSDAAIFTGSVAELAALLLEWQRAGIQGFRLRPGAVPYDLRQIASGLTAELRSRGAFRSRYEADTLRGLLGLPRPASRYAEAR